MLDGYETNLDVMRSCPEYGGGQVTKSGVVRLVLAVAAVSLVIVPPALAGKPSGGSASGGSSGLSLVMVVDANANGLPNWGDTVTFKVSTTATTQPQVRTVCVQNGVQVYFHEGGFYPGDPWAPGDQMFVLQSYSWTGGAADCTATLFYMGRKGEVDVKSFGFQVGA
jgi:hypothetical protein